MIKLFYNSFKIYKQGKSINSIIPEKIIFPNGEESKINKIDSSIIDPYVGEDIEIYYDNKIHSTGKITTLKDNTNIINIISIKGE